MRHTGTNSLLDVLPLTPYRNSGDSPDAQVTYLEDLPHLGASVEIIGVQVGTDALAAAGEIEFDSLGGLTEAEAIVVVLACGQDNARRYLPITISPVTGLTTIGDYTAVAP